MSIRQSDAALPAQKNNPIIKISVPATSANIGPGFDLWGMALNIRNEFIAKIAGQRLDICKFTVRYDSKLPDDCDKKALAAMPLDDANLFSRAYQMVFKHVNVLPIPIDVEIVVGIPLERGLGSSSTATLAGMVMANEILRRTNHPVLSIDTLFSLACEIEGHPDNLAPALWGGWVMSIFSVEQQRYMVFPLKIKAPVQIAGIVPSLTLSTEMAREGLPTQFSRFDMIQQSGSVALMVHLLEKENWSQKEKESFVFAVQDRIHQEPRAVYIPGMLQTFSYWKELGCLGSFLSGAGTTLLGFWDKSTSVPLAQLGEVMNGEKIASQPLMFQLDNVGLTVEILGNK